MSAAASNAHPKRTVSVLARQSSEPAEGTASNTGSAGNSDAPPSSPPPLKKRRRRDKTQKHGPSSSGGDSLQATPPSTRFAAPAKWALDSEKELPNRSPRRPREAPKTDEFTLGKPTQEYLDRVSVASQRSEPSSLVSEFAKAKLLILDLNGTLLYRKKLSTSSTKKPYPRPYIPAFLSWIFHPDNALETMIWSSAQPENVKWMVKVCFGDDKSKLKVVWARDTLGLSKAHYYQKVQTVKNLDVIWEKLPYAVENTLLIDDSPLKAHMQPYNHIVLKEYNLTLFDRRHDSTDDTLLAVIGVLSEAIRQSNVANWIREGGLMKPPPSRTDAEKETERASPQLSSPEVSPARSRFAPSSPVLAGNPEILSDSQAENLAAIETLWFQDQTIVAAWVQVGRAELERLNIAVDVGAIDGESAVGNVLEPATSKPPERKSTSSKDIS
ncbi:hypothetical protein FRC04_004164 [Tulasnella sp. 424]|nr:hypothetical protein FRC04_004164 [Tulasnella sp. 424]KAG8968905.1 hypothetical protein FRC05_001273 [Tulasnella sp. 425]